MARLATDPGPVQVTPRATRQAAYCTSNDDHFLGAVALVNSLRLTGWQDEIVIVDCGLTTRQRALLAAESVLLAAPEDTPPHLLKVVGPLTRPAEVMVVIDADIVITRPLEALVTEAKTSGRLLAVEDILRDRFDERWRDMLQLGELRRQPYVNSGFIIAPLEVGTRVFSEMRELQRLIETERSMIARGRPEDPFYFLDQDVLNALLASDAVRADELCVLEQSCMPLPPFDGVRIVSESQLRVIARDGSTPVGLHHYQRKPWLHPLAPNAYSRLLPRLWLSSDLPLQLRPGDLPVRFRPGRSGTLARSFAATRVVLERNRRNLRIRSRLGAQMSRMECRGMASSAQANGRPDLPPS